MKLAVEASYSTPSDMPVTLIVQAPGNQAISNVRETLKAGSGTVTLKADFVVPETDAIEIYVHRVRKKLQYLGVSIRTIRGLGYLLDRAEA